MSTLSHGMVSRKLMRAAAPREGITWLYYSWGCGKVDCRCPHWQKP